jgi:hypothetical protein
MKLELDVKVLQEQIKALKKNNQDLAQRSKEEASGKVKVHIYICIDISIYIYI